MHPTRIVHLDPARPLVALTATARGMIDNNFVRAAQRAHTELMSAVIAAGRLAEIGSRISLYPDLPQGPNDARCRYVAGVVFGLDLATMHGECQRPEVPLAGSLAWTSIAPGRHAVFLHRGPVHTLHRTWRAIYEGWQPASGQALRDAPPWELRLTRPGEVPPEEMDTEVWLPIA